MRKQNLIWVALVAFILTTAAAAADKFGDKVKAEKIANDTSIYDIKAKYVVNDFFPELRANTYNCYPNCAAEFVIYNKLAADIEPEDVKLEFYDMDGNPSDIMEDIQIEFSDSLAAYTQDKSIHYIKPDEPKKILISATKTINEPVEWIPIISLTTKHGIKAAEKIDLRQTAWAVWNSTSTGTILNGTALYHMDETSGSVMKDSSTGLLNLTISGATINQPGKYNKAYKFDGINDYAIYPTWTNLPREATYSMWINISNVGDTGGTIRNCLLSNMYFRPPGCEGSSYHGPALYVRNNGTIYADIYNGTAISGPQTEAGIIQPNNWYHIVFSYETMANNNYNASIYVDGVLVKYQDNAVRSQDTCTYSKNFTIGAWKKQGIAPYDFYYFTNGTIDEVQIYSRALNQTEVLELYSDGLYEMDNPILSYISPYTAAGNYTSQSYLYAHVGASDASSTNITINLWKKDDGLSTYSLFNTSTQTGAIVTLNFTSLPISNGAFDGGYLINASAIDIWGFSGVSTDLIYYLLSTTTTTTSTTTSTITTTTASTTTSTLTSQSFTPCMTYLRVGDLKEAYKCVYIGDNFTRPDGAPTMGYYFYLIIFGGLTFIVWLKVKDITFAGIFLLVCMGVFKGQFPPQAAVTYYGIVVAAVAATLYGVFKSD